MQAGPAQVTLVATQFVLHNMNAQQYMTSSIEQRVKRAPVKHGNRSAKQPPWDAMISDTADPPAGRLFQRHRSASGLASAC
jgi:hypothetical protein